MKLEIEIPDPPDGCDPAAVQWGRPPEGAWMLCGDMGVMVWRRRSAQVRAETAWVMPYTPELLGLLKPGWVTHDNHAGWQWWRDKPAWSSNLWHSVTRSFTVPFREVPLISGAHAIWEVPHD